MEQMAPSGNVYQAGTLSGNPLAMAAGIAALGALTADVHDRLNERTSRLARSLREMAARRGVPFTADSAGSMWGFFFRAEPVRSFADAKTSDVERFKRFFHAALSRGVYLAPSAFEAAFMSDAHSDADIDETLDRLDDAMEEISG
jgi:glutamate-1-semialdehyde 2,1-aminomutase